MTDNVQAYYDLAAEKEWDRLATVSQIEYFITMKVLDDLIGGRKLKILDLGGGPGRYSIELSKKGHEVTLVDISNANLELAKRKAREQDVEIAELIHASATDLRMLWDNYFGLALSMGPMYHLTADEDLRRANSELLRVLKPRGHVLVAFITRLAVMRDVLLRAPERLIEHQEHYDDVMQRGVIVQSPESGFTDLRLFNAAEIEPMMSEAGFIFERLIGCEGPMNLRLYDNVNQLPEERKTRIFESLVRYSGWPSLLDSSDHLLYVGYKPKEIRAKR